MKYPIEIPKNLDHSLSKKIKNSLWKKIINSIEKKKIEPILKIVKRINNTEGYINLPHPFLKKHKKTFPFKNIKVGMVNFIFFTDSYYKNHWILCQCTSFVDAIFSEKISGKHKNSPREEIFLEPLRKILENTYQKKTHYKKAKFSGFILNQKRPYHYFYDHLKWFLNLKNKKIAIENSFFIPNNLKKNISLVKVKNKFSLFPAIIGVNFLDKNIDSYSNKMEKIIYEDSIKDKYDKITNIIKNDSINKKTLTLWFGISGQKRIWIEQENFLPNVVKKLGSYFDKFIFLIDGFTNFEFNDSEQFNEVNDDNKIVNSIKNKLSSFSNTIVYNLVGENYRKKIQKCQYVNFFITNAGSGQLVPHRFCKKTGILHSNSKHCVFQDGINNTTVRLVNKSFVKDVGNLFDNRSCGSGLISYSIDIQIIIDMLIDMLNLKTNNL
jgi:hypothetical protein